MRFTKLPLAVAPDKDDDDDDDDDDDAVGISLLAAPQDPDPAGYGGRGGAPGSLLAAAAALPFMLRPNEGGFGGITAAGFDVACALLLALLVLPLAFAFAGALGANVARVTLKAALRSTVGAARLDATTEVGTVMRRLTVRSKPSFGRFSRR
jgi:hypothetical protein